MSNDLEPFLKRLHLANARRVWRELVQRAEKEQWPYEQLLHVLYAEDVAHRLAHQAAAASPHVRWARRSSLCGAPDASSVFTASQGKNVRTPQA